MRPDSGYKPCNPTHGLQTATAFDVRRDPCMILPLITTIAAAFTAAWVLGIITQKLRLSPIVGYLLAGVAIGPHTPGFRRRRAPRARSWPSSA